MDDREGWRERARDIRDDGATWWWWSSCLIVSSVGILLSSNNSRNGSVWVSVFLRVAFGTLICSFGLVICYKVSKVPTGNKMVYFVSYVVAIVYLGFKYLSPLFLFLPHLTCRLLCPWKAAREFKVGRKEAKIPFNSSFILGFLMIIQWRGNFSWTSRNTSCFTD